MSTRQYRNAHILWGTLITASIIVLSVVLVTVLIAAAPGGLTPELAVLAVGLTAAALTKLFGWVIDDAE